MFWCLIKEGGYNVPRYMVWLFVNIRSVHMSSYLPTEMKYIVRSRYSLRVLKCSWVCSRVRICLNELFHSEFRLQMWAVWPDDQIVFSRFGHFQQWKFALKHKNCTKVSWKLCPKSNKPEIYCQIFSNIGQSGGMLPNLVTLDVNKKCFWATNGRRVNITFYPDALK